MGYKRAIVLCLFFAALASAQSKDQVAIINTVDDGNPPIALLELTHLTDKLREIAVGILPKSRYSVMTTESIVALFESVEEAARACNESTCLVELGRKITADYVAQGRIGRFGGDLTIKVELYHSMSGSLVASFTGNSKEVHGLLSILDAKAPDMFKKMLPVSGGPGFGKRFLVNLNSEPSGAALSFNGAPVASCLKTPCSLELSEGDVRMAAALERYEIVDTTVSITQNNQSVNIKLLSNFGVLEIKPAYIDGIGGEEGWSLLINGLASSSWENSLSPGNYDVRLAHRCYEDVSFMAGVARGKREVFDLASYAKLKMNGSVLVCPKTELAEQKPVEAAYEPKPEAANKFRFGIRANGGLVFGADFIRNDIYGDFFGNGFGLGIGVVFMIPISSIYFAPEVSFEFIGFEGIGTKEKEMWVSDKADIGLEIPLLFKFRHKKENKVYFGIGPSLGYVIMQITQKDKDHWNEYPNSDEIKYYFSKSRFSIGIAAELGYRLGSNFAIDVRVLGSFPVDYEYYEYDKYGIIFESSIFFLLRPQLGVNILF